MILDTFYGWGLRRMSWVCQQFSFDGFFIVLRNFMRSNTQQEVIKVRGYKSGFELQEKQFSYSSRNQINAGQQLPTKIKAFNKSRQQVFAINRISFCPKNVLKSSWETSSSFFLFGDRRSFLFWAIYAISLEFISSFALLYLRSCAGI